MTVLSPTDPYGLDDLLIAIGMLFACLCGGYALLELGSMFGRMHRGDGDCK